MFRCWYDVTNTLNDESYVHWSIVWAFVISKQQRLRGKLETPLNFVGYKTMISKQIMRFQ